MLNSEIIRFGLEVIFWVFLGLEVLFVLFFYYKFVFHRQKAKNKDHFPGVSVVIPARNEAHNLQQNLPLILEQDYPDFQVVVVNHASEDDSSFVLQRLEQKYSNLYVTHIPYSSASFHTKKLALTIGIKAAKHDIIVFTDADCKPASNQWLKRIVARYDQETKIVLGYGGYERSRGLLDKLVRTETAFIAMQYFGFALRGMPYMGVGRNISWRKSFFEQVGGYIRHSHEPSGADDLFVNWFGNGKNTRVEYSAESFTYSKMPKSFKEWKLQKQRHFGSFRYYKFWSKFLITLEPVSRVMMWISFLVLIILGRVEYFVILGIVLREVLVYLSFIFSAKKLREKGLWWFYPIYDLIQPWLHLAIYVNKSSNRGGRWK